MKFKKFKMAIMGWSIRSLSYLKVVRTSRKTKRLRIRLMMTFEGLLSTRQAP